MNENDKVIESLIKDIETKEVELAELSKIKYTYITNCIVEHKGRKINLRIADESNLLDLAKDLLTDLKAYKKASEFLEIDAKPQMFLGFETTDWLTDIKTAVKERVITKKTNELAVMKNELKELYSVDKKVSNRIDEIKKRIS